jgi:DNA-binding NarL/FixJ family response regulator
MTVRETQISKSLCEGISIEDIAASLKITEGTVKTHIRNIYRKTWVHNKISMLLRFIEDINNHASDGLESH